MQKARLEQFIKSDEQLAELARLRKRDINVLRDVLEGMSPEDVGEKYDLRRERVGQISAKIMTMLYFRSKDRTGITELPKRIVKMQAARAVWLPKLEATLEALEDTTK